jgi:hypothetical protein
LSRSLTRLQALVLGAVVLLGAGLAVLGLFTVGSRGWFGKDGFTVRVGFPEIRGVEVGTRVRIRGIDAGEVAGITPPESPERPVLLHLRLKGEHRGLVRANSTVRIVNEGMIGGKVLEIHTPAGPGSEQPAAEGAELRAEPSAELTDVLAQVGQALKGIQDGEGTFGRLAKDPRLYESLVALARQSTETMAQGKEAVASIQRDADAMKRLPLIGRYVEDPQGLLVRPGSECNRRYYAEEDLFEPGRAVLTGQGRRHLDSLAPWLESMKHPGSDVVVAAYADPHKVPPPTAKLITQQQAEAVCTYLTRNHGVHKMGWFSSRKVTPLGQGVVQPPPDPAEHTPLPPARVEVLVFVPQG